MTTTFPALKAVEDEIAAKAKDLNAIFDEAGADLDMDKVKSLSGDSAAKAAEIRKRNDELTDLGKKRDGLTEVAKAYAAARSMQDAPQIEPGTDPGAKGGRPAEAKSFGELFTESTAYKNRIRSGAGPEAHLEIGLKTLFQTSAGWTPETTRTGRVVDFATRPLQIIDLIPQTTTQQVAVVYMEETTFTNNAAEIAEAGAYVESALALTERSSPVKKIGTWIPVTDEQLEDEQQARGYLNNRLPFMVKQRLDSQIMVGDGTGANLTGLLNTSGIQTQAKGTDPVPDAVYKAMVKVMVTGQAMPNAYATNPLDWQDVRLLRTADGIYIWGNPSDAGPERIWGLNVALCQGITQNTGVVGDFANFAELAVKRGLDVQISNSHDTFFVNGKQAVRADIRAALVFYRPAAFCTVTGI